MLRKKHRENDQREDASARSKKEIGNSIRRIQKNINKIDAPHGRDMYSKRMGIIEPVFGNIRNAKRLDHFTLRTKKKVDIQWKLYCMVHNIEKIANYAEFENRE